MDFLPKELAAWGRRDKKTKMLGICPGYCWLFLAGHLYNVMNLDELIDEILSFQEVKGNGEFGALQIWQS